MVPNIKSLPELRAEISELKRRLDRIRKQLPGPEHDSKEDLTQQVRQLVGKCNILAVCSGSLNANEILLTCFYELLNVFNLRTGLLHLTDSTSDVLFLKTHENISPPLLEKIETVEPGATPVGQAAKTHKPVFIESVEKFGGRVKPFWENDELKSGVSIPLHGSYGLICIFTLGAEKPAFFSENRMHYITSVIQHAVSAVERVQKLQEDPDMISSIKTKRSPVSRIIETLPEGIILADNEGIVLSANTFCSQLTGYRASDLTGQSVASLIPGWINRDRFKQYLGFTRQIEERKNASTGPVQLFRKDGTGYFGNITVEFIDNEDSNNPVGCTVIVTKAAQPLESGQDFARSESMVRTLIQNSPSGSVAADVNGTITHTAPEFLVLYGIQSEDDITGTHLLDLIAPEDRVAGIRMLDSLKEQGNRQEQTLTLQKKNGARFTGKMRLNYVIDPDGGPQGMMAFISDLPAVSPAHEENSGTSIRDNLTGFYSRPYFDDQLERLNRDIARLYPLSIFIIEVHGIELINEIFGSDTGDDLLLTVGEIISRPFRKIDTPARIDGKRFGIVLPQTPVGVVKAKKDIILKKAAQYNTGENAVPLSISIGLSVTDDVGDGTIYDVYHRSLADLEEERLALNMSPGQKIMQILMENLETRGFINNDPETPLWKAMQKVLSEAELPDNEIRNLQFMVHAHNMGYIAVPERIRKKTDKLNPAEFEMVKKHSQIGCNIAIQSVEYASVATQILHHHERWDGNGYPAGLRGKRIPRECRIFSVIDAYAAMVSQRPYRRKKSHQNALNEILEESGTQFDPDIADEIVTILT